MTQKEILELLSQAPIVAAVKDEQNLVACLGSDAKVVFVLHGTVLDIATIVRRIQAADKVAIVHIDLIEGLAAREAAVDYIATATQAEGIISTKSALVKRAKEKGLLGIRRFFLLDSMALQSMDKQVSPSSADMLEVLPGAMPKILRAVVASSSLPVIAGGLIQDKEDVVNALSAGAVGISSTNPAVWYM